LKTHWKILAWLLLGAVVGGALQLFVEARAISGIAVADGDGGARVTRAGKGLEAGDVISEVVRRRGSSDEERVPVTDAASYGEAVATSDVGDVLWHRLATGKLEPVTLDMDPSSPRALWIRPFAFVADVFLRLLKMLIVPLILTSIITGVVGVGSGRDLRRLGIKTFAYYIATSLLAIVLGLVLVNTIRPGVGARLGLAMDDRFSEVSETSFLDVILRMVPENVFEAFGANINMLQVIFFALLFGYFILRVEGKHQESLKGFFEAAFEVTMKLAEFVLSLIPYGVFCLLVKVVASTGFGVFEPLLVYMVTVTLALVLHAVVTLPILLKVLARISPLKWAKAMSPALITAYSTSSSSMTLPVSLDVVEKRGGISNRIVSFVQPLGATINMDGTALYECIGVIFLSQYYASLSPELTLTLGDQVLVVFMALTASIGAAGIPSAGLIMMVTILSALDLPVEGAALLLAVDRPLDMLRTLVNVWSDTCGSAVVARSEGEVPLAAGEGAGSPG
jgi:Na+/H+-dicarboxylate symporter